MLYTLPLSAGYRRAKVVAGVGSAVLVAGVGIGVGVGAPALAEMLTSDPDLRKAVIFGVVLLAFAVLLGVFKAALSIVKPWRDGARRWDAAKMEGFADALKRQHGVSGLSAEECLQAVEDFHRRGDVLSVENTGATGKNPGFPAVMRGEYPLSVSVGSSKREVCLGRAHGDWVLVEPGDAYQPLPVMQTRGEAF